MATKKMRGFFRYPECPLRVACDGNRLAAGRTICGKCERRVEERKKPVFLKGERRAG